MWSYTSMSCTLCNSLWDITCAAQQTSFLSELVWCTTNIRVWGWSIDLQLWIDLIHARLASYSFLLLKPAAWKTCALNPYHFCKSTSQCEEKSADKTPRIENQPHKSVNAHLHFTEECICLWEQMKSSNENIDLNDIFISQCSYSMKQI